MIEQLLDRIKKGERKAQQEFYYRFSVYMFRTAYRYVTQEQDAGSIVNMAFFRIFDHIGEFTFQDEKKMMAWMKKIAINEALMFLRQKITYCELNETGTESFMIDEDCEGYLNVEEYYAVIRKLPDDLRIIFNLYAIDGYSHREIAKQLAVSESTSRVYLSRARKILQTYLFNAGLTYGKKEYR